MIRIFVDLGFTFIRQPIKLAISDKFKVEFVDNEQLSDIVITSTNPPNKPTLLLTDDICNLYEKENVFDICPIPSDVSEMETLLLKLGRLIDVVSSR
jgi:hypothetical protein